MYKYLIYLLFILVVSVETQNYGKFNLSVIAFNLCKGPKSKDCCTGTTQVIDNASIFLEFVVKENVIPTTSKLVLSSIEAPDPLRLQLNRPCDSLFLKPFMSSMFNIKNKCEIQKGTYKLRLNLQEMAQKYYGGKYFYGGWHVKATVFNNHCNFICVDNKLLFIPA